jgi:hypothetical protein
MCRIGKSSFWLENLSVRWNPLRILGVLLSLELRLCRALPESASHSHVACSASRCDVRGRQPLWKRGLGVAAPRCPSADKSMVVEILATGQLYEWSCRSAAGLGLESSQRHWLYNSSRLPIVAICLWFLLGFRCCWSAIRPCEDCNVWPHSGVQFSPAGLVGLWS